MITLTETPNEKSSFAFNIVLTDGDGASVPLTDLTSVRWQLSDLDGTVINNRTFANGLVTENPIMLTDDDLAITNSGPCRIIAISVIYDSDLGTGLTGNEEAKFKITDLVNIS